MEAAKDVGVFSLGLRDETEGRDYLRQEAGEAEFQLSGAGIWEAW